MRYLALMLLGPWLLILCWIYWTYPKQLPRTSTRRAFDAVAVGVMAFVTLEFAMLGFDHATMPGVEPLGRLSGGIWRQVAPALYGYAAFSVVLIFAALVRHLIWRRR